MDKMKKKKKNLWRPNKEYPSYIYICILQLEIGLVLFEQHILLHQQHLLLTQLHHQLVIPQETHHNTLKMHLWRPSPGVMASGRDGEISFN